MPPTIAHLAAALILVGGSACESNDPADPDGPPPVVDAEPVPTADAPDPAAAMVDCTATNPGCPTLVIAGDAPATTPARGYADPSMRRDPANDRLWLAYSWPKATALPGGGGVVTVDNHLAHSDDAGATWTFDGEMWTATPATSPLDGAAGYFNAETVALAVDGTTWYSARFRYFTDAAGPKVSSFHIRVATAASPAQLATAPELALGGDLTAPQWNVDTNLAALSPELAGCTWNDPGIIVVGGTLYLAIECLLFTQQGEQDDLEFIAMFATDPSGPVGTWTWRYLGRLSDHADAVELGGTNLLQAELTRGQDGALLLVVSPSAPAAPLATHYGCRAVEIAMLDPPALARFGSGKLRVRASATASDLAPAGPGSCTYDPGSTTGLVLVRRLLAPGVLDNTLNATGLQP